MTYAYQNATLVLPGGIRIPLRSVVTLRECSAWGCANLVRRHGPERCAMHATALDVAFQVMAPIFQADQVLAFFLARKWGRA